MSRDTVPVSENKTDPYAAPSSIECDRISILDRVKDTLGWRTLPPYSQSTDEYIPLVSHPIASKLPVPAVNPWNQSTSLEGGRSKCNFVQLDRDLLIAAMSDDHAAMEPLLEFGASWRASVNIEDVARTSVIKYAIDHQSLSLIQVLKPYIIHDIGLYRQLVETHLETYNIQECEDESHRNLRIRADLYLASEVLGTENNQFLLDLTQEIYDLGFIIADKYAELLKKRAATKSELKNDSKASNLFPFPRCEKAKQKTPPTSLESSIESLDGVAHYQPRVAPMDNLNPENIDLGLRQRRPASTTKTSVVSNGVFA